MRFPTPTFCSLGLQPYTYRTPYAGTRIVGSSGRLNLRPEGRLVGILPLDRYRYQALAPHACPLVIYTLLQFPVRCHHRPHITCALFYHMPGLDHQRRLY